MRLDRRAMLAGAAAILPTAARARWPGDPPGEHGIPLPQTAPGAELDVVDLWPGDPPGGGGPKPSAEGYRFDETDRGVISRVATPCMLVIRPDKPNGAAMLVASGGGYRKIDIGHEGIPVGAMLAKAGITAFVLVYRLPGEGWEEGPDAPRQDAQRAMRLIRSGAAGFGIDPARIGVMGFSAGAHLMGEAAVSPDAPLYDAVDERDATSAAAAVAALIYPVVTLMAPFDKTIVTRRVLIGDSPTEEERRAYSVDAQVTDRTPPTFLVQASDDPIAVVDHPLMMYRALRAKRIPAEMHLFERGGHGFGLGVPGTPVAAWPALFLAWVRGRGFLKG